LLCLGLLPQALQRADAEHFLFVAVVILPIALAEWLPDRLGHQGDRITRPAVIVSCLVVIASGLALAAVVPRPTVARHGDRVLLAASTADATALEEAATRVRSHLRRDDRLFVGLTDMSQAGVNAAFLYFLLPRYIPNAYYLDLAPGVSERAGSRLLSDVKQADVLVLTSYTSRQRRATFPYVREGSQLVNHYVAQHYCPVDRFGRFTVYLRRCSVLAENGRAQ
jgi:hypothetical protein